jgi:hypothetical protein
MFIVGNITTGTKKCNNRTTAPLYTLVIRLVSCAYDDKNKVANIMCKHMPVFRY